MIFDVFQPVAAGTAEWADTTFSRRESALYVLYQRRQQWYCTKGLWLKTSPCHNLPKFNWFGSAASRSPPSCHIAKQPCFHVGSKLHCTPWLQEQAWIYSRNKRDKNHANGRSTTSPANKTGTTSDNHDDANNLGATLLTTTTSTTTTTVLHALSALKAAKVLKHVETTVRPKFQGLARRNVQLVPTNTCLRCLLLVESSQLVAAPRPLALCRPTVPEKNRGC